MEVAFLIAIAISLVTSVMFFLNADSKWSAAK